MAQKLKDTAGEGHNSGLTPEELAKAIREHSVVTAAHEEDARKVSAAKKKSNQEFKALTGMTIKDFNFADRLASMEDRGEQREKMNNMQVCFNALSEGDQLNWIEAEEKTPTNPDNKK